MRKIYVSLFFAFFSIFVSTVTQAQLTGTKTIPGDYPSIAAAVTDLNAQGVGAGGVTFNVAAGHTEVSDIPVITASGTNTNPIVFQKSGAGNNPKITPLTGGTIASSTTLGSNGDGIVVINGGDYITFDGIDLETDASFTANAMYEYGYFLKKASGTDACKNITIRNCSIKLNKTTIYSFGIFISNISGTTSVTVTSTGGRSENIRVHNNTISNVYGGIQVRGFLASSPYDFYDQNNRIGTDGGNIISNFAGGSTASYGIYSIYQNNLDVSNNIINNTAGGGSAASSLIYGVFNSTGTTSSFIAANNNISITSSSTTSSVYGINNAATGDLTMNGNNVTLNNSASSSGTYGYLYNSGGTAATSISISGNTFSAGTITASTASYLVYNSVTTAAAVTIQNNVTSGTITRGGSSIIYGYYSLSSPTGTENISGNNFSDLVINGTTAFTGIISNTTASHTHNVFNNIVSNISGTTTGTLTGISLGSANTRSVYSNRIFNMNCAGSVVGIANGTGGATVLNIYKNKIYDLNSSSTGTTAGLVTGILISSGTTNSAANVYNNLVGNLTAPAATGTDAIRGIASTSTTATTSVNIYYNSIFIEATSSGANFGSSGIFHTTSATATTANLTLRNNVIINKSTPNGTGVTAAYRRSSTALANYNAASDNNLFYAGTASPTQLIYSDGTNNIDDLNNYKTFISSVGADQNSVTEDLPLQSTTGSSTDFLKFSTTIVNKAESGAVNITGITDDYAGNIRQGNTGYTGTGTKPDIGAWELEGTQPSCSGTPAASNTLVSANPACAGQNLVLTLSQTYLGVTYQWQSSGDNITYTNITGETSASLLIPGPSTSTWYRCIITCSGNDRISTPVQVIINPPLSGSYTINNTLATGGTNYNNFADAINELNCRGASGPVVFNVSAGQTFNEATNLVITFEGTAANTITFQKSGAGANPTIVRTGTSATNDFVLRLNGADYITFDGINIDQSGTSSTDWVEYGIHIVNASSTNGSAYNRFKNGVVSLSNANVNAKGVYIQSPITPTALSGTNNNNRFLNMTIQNSFEGYRINGATNTYPDDGNEINTESAGTSMVQNLGNGTVTGSLYGVFATYQTNFKVRNTEINNLTPGGTSLVYGIALQTSSANTAEFSSNHIHGLTGGGTVNGINVTSADSVDIFNNQIHTLSTTGNASALRGIDAGGTGASINIYNNRIYMLTSSGTTSTTAVGIESGTGDMFTIYNNMISALAAPASTSTTGGTKGIATSGTTTGQIVKVYFNTVLLADAGTAGAYSSAGFYNSSSTPVIDFRNNIIINKSTPGATGRVVAYWKNNTTINQDPATNNNLYYAGTPGTSNLLYYDGTNAAQTLAALQSITNMGSRENLSVTEDVVFAPVVNGIIRPGAAPTLVESSGQVIAGLATDFENTARGPYPLAGQTNGGGFAPDLGADEGDFMYIVPPLPDCPTLTAPVDNASNICSYDDVVLKWTAATTGGLPSLGYDVFFGTSTTPPFVANTNATSYTVSGLSPNTTYYWKIVPKNGAGSAVGCPTYSFTTVNAAITSTTNGSRCGEGTVNLSATGNGTINWYATATGGTPLGTGPVFTTPSLTSTTTYYVSAQIGGGTINTAKLAPDPSATGTTLTTYGLVFTLTEPVFLSSVQVFSTTGTAITVSLFNSDGTTQLQTTGSVSVTAGSSPQINLGWSIPAGTYRLSANGMTGNFLRDGASTPSVVYPIALGTVGQINGFHSSITGSVTTTQAYYFLYNWVIRTGCESPRVPVTATVNTAPSISASATTSTICAGQSTQLNVTSANTGYSYTWNPGNLAGAMQTVSPTTSTTYTVTATDNSGGPNDGCANSATVNITVNPAPSPLTITPASVSVCAGAPAQLLTASGGINDMQFNFGTQANQNTASTTAAGYPAPYTLYYGGQRMQMLITAAELAAAGFSAGATFNNIQFPVVSLGSNWGSSTTACQNFQVSIGQTSLTSISAFQSGLTQVVAPGNFTPSVGYSNTHTFSTPFTWDGTSNLIIETTFSNAITGTTNDLVTQYNSPTAFQSTIVYRADGLSAATVAAATTVSFSYNARPDLRLNGSMINQIVWSPTTNLYTDAAASIPYTGGSATAVYALPVSNQTYTATATNSFTCSSSNTVAVTIVPPPSATIAYTGSPYCSNAGTASVTLTGSTGGVFSSTAGLSINAATGDINLGASTPGTYTVTYTIAAANACPQFQTTTSVTIDAVPSATISYAGTPYCSGGGTATVTFSGTTGGTYSSTAGLVINSTTGEIDLAASTVGTYTVTYTIAAGGCPQYQATTSVTISTSPSATISYAGSPYCSNGSTATVTQTGSTGGTYSSTAGLSINATTGEVNIAASTPGTYTVTYSIAAAGGCSAFQTTATITITAAPAATISYAGSPYCSNGGTATVTQTGTTGGTYSSTAGLSINASTGAVNLGASTPGTYTVTYTVPAANGCAQFQTTTTITITAAPSATISYAGSPYCSNGGTANVTQTGTVGGTYSSTAGLSINASTGAVNLGASTPGTYTVTYTVAAANGCAQFQTTANITITAAPSATISYAGSPYCSSGGTATVTQTGTTGGTYSSTAGLSINASTGEVNLGASTAGTYTVTYTVPAANGCAQFQTTTSITISAAPNATISYAGSPYCGNAGTAVVTRTGNTGGTYSSTSGLSINSATGAVNLNASTPGTYTVTYSLPAANGCPAFQTTTSITITAPPTATIAYTGSPYCSSAGSATVTRTGTAGGTYSSTAGLVIDAATGAVDLATSATGTYTVTYTIAAANGCAQVQATTSITITAQPSATISYSGSPFCLNGTALVTRTGTAGGTYSAAAGLSINASTGAIDLAASTPGTYTVTYTIAAGSGCSQFQATTSVMLLNNGTWRGAVSNDWNNAGNWCGGVPTSATDVVIPAGVPNMPVLTGLAGAARNISISNGASLTIGAAGVLDLYGNITGTGNFNATAGSIVFRSVNPQTVPGFTATNVTMNGAGGVTPGGNTVITGTLLLLNGNITIGNNTLTLNNSSNGTLSSHIITNGTGNVIVANLAASQTRTIPVGSDATSYNPATLTANAGHTTDNFTVRVQQGVFENGVSGATYTSHVANRMWVINEATTGGSNVNVTLQWSGAQELPSFDRNRSYIMQHDGTNWVRGTGSAAAGADPYSQTKLNVTSFSPFAVETQRIPRPVTGIYPNPAKTTLNVVMEVPSAQPVTIRVFDASGRLVKQHVVNLLTGLNQYTMNVFDLSSGIHTLRVSSVLNDKLLVAQFFKE